MNKQIRNVAPFLVAAVVVVSAVYGAYSEVVKILVVVVAALMIILIANRYATPRWDLSPSQRDRENFYRMPAFILAVTLAGVLYVGEKGFEHLSNSLTLWLFFGGFAVVLISGAKKKSS